MNGKEKKKKKNKLRKLDESSLSPKLVRLARSHWIWIKGRRMQRSRGRVRIMSLIEILHI